MAALHDPSIGPDLLERIQRRVLWLSALMVHHANTRANADGTKVGGHQASSASVVSLMTALYFAHLRSGDVVATKAHASPAFYAIEYLRGRLTAEDLRILRAFGGLQAYPSRRKNPAVVDLSTGSMGLGAASTLFGALAARYVEDHRQTLDRVTPDGRRRQLAQWFGAAGWRVIELRWGRRLEALFPRPGGKRLR